MTLLVHDFTDEMGVWRRVRVHILTSLTAGGRHAQHDADTIQVRREQSKLEVGAVPLMLHRQRTAMQPRPGQPWMGHHESVATCDVVLAPGMLVVHTSSM